MRFILISSVPSNMFRRTILRRVYPYAQATCRPGFQSYEGVSPQFQIFYTGVRSFFKRQVDMRKMTVPLAFAATATLITVAVMSLVSNAVNVYAQARPVSSYAEDRAAIEDLQARYLFALDFHDPDLYVSTFTPDGVLESGSGDVKGREAIKAVIAKMPNPAARPAFEPPPLDTTSRTSSSR